jgi:hypothetical protein
MVKKASDVSKQKSTGSHFTPDNLSAFLADRIIQFYDFARATNENTLICDPSCGDGNLLVALKQKLNNPNVKFLGIESDIDSYTDAQKRLATHKNISLLNSDFLELYIENFAEKDLFEQTNKLKMQKPNVIIANPPYVRTQVLGSSKSQDIANLFLLKGRVDLYYAFLIAMVNSLEDKGIIGVITSNRFLYTRSGESIREFLKAKLNILEIYDLGDTKFFDAAVLPAIIIGQKKNSNVNSGKTSFSKIYQSQFLSTNTKSILKKEDLLYLSSNLFNGTVQLNNSSYIINSNSINLPIDSNTPWTLTEPKPQLKLNAKKTYIVKDFLKVKVGIKTTADNVFIRNNWDSLSECPEQDLLKPLISSCDIHKWKMNQSTANKILYPYMNAESRVAVDLKSFPLAKKYFNLYEDQLKGRKYVLEAGREWFEIWVPHKPLDWKYPKLVFPDISKEPQFMLDLEGYLVNGNCYWIPAHKKEDEELLYLVMGVSNSNFLEYYYDLHFGNKLYSGKRRFITQYVEKFPLPDPNSIEAEKIIKFAKKAFQAVAHENSLEVTEILSDYFSMKLSKEYRLSSK